MSPRQRPPPQPKYVHPSHSGGFHPSAPSLAFLRSKHESDRSRQTRPVLRLDLELPASGLGECVEFRLPVVVAGAPLTRNPPLLFQPVERGIEGSLLDLQVVAGELRDTEG